MAAAADREAVASACLAAIDGAFFRALSEPARVDLLRTLIVKGRADVGTIASDAPRDRSVTARHLQVLQAAGLVRSFREGRRTYYELDGDRVLTQLETLVALFRSIVPLCCADPSGPSGADGGTVIGDGRPSPGRRII